MADTKNSRIKEVPGLPGLYSEAIADTITITYDVVDPLETRVGFGFRDYLRKDDGSVVSFANGNYDLITVGFREILAMELGISALELMEAIRAAADIAHNRLRGG